MDEKCIGLQPLEHQVNAYSEFQVNIFSNNRDIT